LDQNPLTIEHAQRILIKQIVKDKLFLDIPKKCLFAELETENEGYFLFALRFDPECCGLKSESTLIDRLAVIRHSKEIVWWDLCDPTQFKPYSSFLKFRRKPARPVGLTARSTRTQPLRIGFINHGAASVAPVSSNR